MNNKKSIGVLNTLIQTNTDRINRHTNAANETSDESLKKLFAEFVDTSKKCKQELSHEVISLGGTPRFKDTITSNAFIRAWIDVEAALGSKDNNPLFSCSEHGEALVKGNYQKALADSIKRFSPKQRMMVEKQMAMLDTDQVNVKTMREKLV